MEEWYMLIGVSYINIVLNGEGEVKQYRSVYFWYLFLVLQMDDGF